MGRARQSVRQTNWATGTWAAQLTQHDITRSTNTYTRTEVADGAGGVRRGRYAHSAGAEGNDRRLWLLPTYERDTRLLVPWYAHTLHSAGTTQVGQAVRVRDDPDGITRAYVIRHDIQFGLDYLLQIGLWTWPTGSFDSLTVDLIGASADLTGIHRKVTATMQRTGNVVTATGLPLNHGIAVGHTVGADGVDNSYDGNFVVASAPSSTSLTWAQVAADAGATTGTIDDFDGVFPLNVEALITTPSTGTELAVRAWRTDQPVASWSDPTHAIRLQDTGGADPYPGRRGRSGLYVGHCDPGEFVEWGAIERERIR